MPPPMGAVQRQAETPGSNGLPLHGAYANPVTSFVGRELEVKEVTGLLDSGRLVTLTGPGGTGKTRLAVALAQADLDAGYEVAFVDCAPLVDADLVPAAIVSALGLRATSRVAPLERAIQRIRARRFLIVLDNLERLLAAAPAISELVSRCPHLRVVCTSRIPLRLSMEQAYEVPPLPLPTASPDSAGSTIGHAGAVALFLDRSRAAAPSSLAAADELSDIAEICRRLDGLPLTIELAAARTRHLPPAAMLARLDSRLPLLTGGPSDAPARHQALRDTIAWSHDLLDPSAAEMFARLSVFAGSFSLRAATEVAFDGPGVPEVEVLERLSGLVDHSLLNASVPSVTGGADPRYSMLDTIREFATEQVTDRERLGRRHAEYFLKLAEAADAKAEGPEQGHSARSVTTDIENLRAALGWFKQHQQPTQLLRLAAALGSYWINQGDLQEGARWTHDAQESQPGGPTVAYAKARRREARLAHLLGDRQSALTLITASLEASRSLGDEDGESEALCWHGMFLADAMDLGRAHELVEEGLAVARSVGSAMRIARSLHYLAILAMLQGETEKSRRLYEEAIAEARLCGDKREVAIALVSFADEIVLAEDPERALGLFTEGLQLLREVDAAGYVGWASLLKGLGLVRLGDLEAARERIVDGTRSARDGGAIPDLIIALDVTAEWLGSAGAPADAVRTWSAATHAREVIEAPVLPYERARLDPGLARDRSALTKASAERAWASGQDGDLDDALDEALATLSAVPLPRGGDARSRRGPFELTPREHEVVALLAEGHSDGEIGEQLFISRKTASVHVANIKGRLGANSRVETVTTAIRLGLVSTSPPGEDH